MRYYIKYLKNGPVGLRTQTLITTSGLWVQTLFTVGDLVAAFQALPNSPLSSAFAEGLTLHSIVNGVETTYNSDDPLTVLGDNGRNATSPLIIRIGINAFLSNILQDIEKALIKRTTTGIQRNHPRRPEVVGRWEDFLTDAARYEYPTTPIRSEVVLPGTTGIKLRIERDVDTVIQNHLHNFNRIFRDQGKACRFESTAPPLEFIGVSDYVLHLDSKKVLSFIENKTPDDLPVRHHQNGQLFDLLEMYNEDIQNKRAPDDDIGRADVRSLIDQVFGYLTLNNLSYGCVTCYDVTYFLWRPRKGTLLISHPIFNHSSHPTLLQSLYYFVELVLQGHDTEKQALKRIPRGYAKETTCQEELETGERSTQEDSDSGSNYSSSRRRKSKRINNKRTKYNLNLDSLRSGTVLGSGATGQVIRLKDSDIVVKHCDSYNNPDGFEMLQTEIAIYEKLSRLNLEYVPRYFGECEFYGQHFIALEFIPGNHCDWRTSKELKKKLNFVIRDLKSFGVVHQDLRPENVLLTPEGDIKLIDFGKADIQ